MGPLRVFVVVTVATVSMLVWGQPGSAQSSSSATEPSEEDISDIDELDLAELLEPPVVESATKREQPVEEAPISVTLLDRETIHVATGTNLAEALRFVPGAHVLQLEANQYFVGMRGLNPLNSNRVLTLLDGREVGDLSFGRVNWEVLPAHPGDVEKVEVIRGPGSTVYGANAFSGVVNITTARPLDRPGLSAEVSTGAQVTSSPEGSDATSIDNVGSGFVAYGWANEAETFGIRNSLGFTHRPEFTRTDQERIHGEFGYHDRLALQLRHEHQELNVDLSHAFAESRLFLNTETDPLIVAESEQTVVLRYRHDVAPEVLTARVNVNGRRSRIEASSERPTYHVFGGSSLVSLNLFDARLRTTFGGDVSSRQTRDFFDRDANWLGAGLAVESELAMDEDRVWLASLGLRAEQIVVDDNESVEATYRNATPRGAVIWRFAKEHTLRLSYSTAVRTPSTFESFVGVVVQIQEEPEPPNTILQANPALVPEEVQSLELGYRGLIAGTLRLDAVLFAQRIEGQVDQRRTGDLPRVVSNELDLDQIGFELGTRFGLTSRTSGFANYTFTHTELTDTGDRIDEFPRFIGAGGIEQRLPAQSRLLVDVYVTSPWSPTFFDQTPTGFALVTRNQTWQAIANFELSREMKTDLGDGAIYIKGRNVLGVFRDREDLRQYPSFTADSIGATFLIGARLEGL